MNIISDKEAIRHILQAKGRYVCYLGAGASKEAGVKTAQEICDDIREKLLKDANIPNRKSKKQIEQWANSTLNWNDPSRRYSTCIQKGYPNMAGRVQYFREMLQGVRPAFCHYATALLIARGYFKRTCVTTNFDKLLESAFTQQGDLECQPIRTDAEAQYWENGQNRCYIVKLHGDYDTYNISNTRDETITISPSIRSIVKRLSQNAGMLVIGTAGNEKSIHTMFDELTSNNAADKVLSFGLLWGVYMGSSKPKNITMNKLKRLVENHIDKGVVFRDIKDLIKRNGSKNELFCFFPIWGTGNFIFDLIESIDDSELKAMAELYLDHQMRLRHVFTRAGLPESAIIKHISSLDKRKNILSLKSGVMSSKPEEVFTAQSKHFPLEIRIIYGDITSRSLLEAEEFQALGRGIISSDDTCISAGGGVAFQLLNEAGLHNILNELAKFSSPIEHGTVVVTSGGKLPVQYILHAAAVKIEKNATYKVSKPAVRKTMRAALDKASALAVGALWVPLMGAGVASLPAEESLEGILEAIAAWGSKRRKAIIMIVIYREKDLPRHHVYQCLLRKLKSRFSIHNI